MQVLSTLLLQPSKLFLLPSLLILLLVFFSSNPVMALNFSNKIDSTETQASLKKNLKLLQVSPTLNKSRLYTISGIWAITYGSSIYTLSNFWYDDLQGFRFFDDWKNWLQIDKMGHAHTAYFQGAWGAKIMQWAGVPNKKATLIGGSIGFLNQTIIEILDGQSPNYGWSNTDFLANAVGSAVYIGQQLWWKEQRILFKFGYTPQNYGKYQNKLIEDVAMQEFGSGTEAFFKDYNAQTYWISTNLHSFLPEANKCPKWLNVAVGFGADQMLHATSNINKGINEIQRRREFYLSLDVDLSKIKTNNRLLKTALFLLNVFKVPFPALRINSDGEAKVLLLGF